METAVASSKGMQTRNSPDFLCPSRGEYAMHRWLGLEYQANVKNNFTGLLSKTQMKPDFSRVSKNQLLPEFTKLL